MGTELTETVWILEIRSENGYTFDLKQGKGLENCDAHHHKSPQEYPPPLHLSKIRAHSALAVYTA